MNKPWRHAFSEAELKEIDAAPQGSLVQRMAQLLDSMVSIPSERERLLIPMRRTPYRQFRG